MTCDETQELIARGPRAISRGERAAVYAHLRECMGCVFYVAKLTDRLFPDGMPAEDQAVSCRMMARDMNDPEFRKIVFEGEHEFPLILRRLP